MNILVTGAAGFIGHSMVKKLVAEDNDVVGIDNINSYYDTKLKYARLADTGIRRDAIDYGKAVVSDVYSNYSFVKMDLSDRTGMCSLFGSHVFDCVINLAGQAGVRYSIENPFAYIESNVTGFLTVLECCRHEGVSHLIYASSSSVYGEENDVPYNEDAPTDHPVSLYAATKKSNELMAYAYSKLYGLRATGLRFFTVYGPWGRPDMAPFLFLRAILAGEPIRVFNNGQMSRDFTYIDDITSGVMSIVRSVQNKQEGVPHHIYNIGNSAPVVLLDFIDAIEKVVGRKAVMYMEGMQPGDVHRTYADISRMRRDFGYEPSTPIDKGIKAFYEWYMAERQAFE